MERQYTFEAIGTWWVIDIFDSLNDKASESLLLSIQEEIDAFNETYSRFKPSSLVSKIKEAPGTYLFPSNATPLFEIYKKIYDLTEGKFTPLIGSTLEQTGYDKEYSLVEQQEITAPLSWEEVMDYEAPYLFTKKPALLDFGAGGKGYLVDLVSILIETHGVQSYCIDAGGDIRSHTSSGVTVGLEDPNDFSKVIGTVFLSYDALCGSSGSRRTWGKYHHILDPHTLSSPTDIIAVWVRADTTLVADAISTALFFTKADILVPHFSFEYLILHNDYSIEVSPLFNAELFTS